MNSYTVILQYPDYLDGGHYVTCTEAATIREAVAKVRAECCDALGDDCLDDPDDLLCLFVFGGDCKLVGEGSFNGEWFADEDPAPTEPAPTATDADAWERAILTWRAFTNLHQAGWFDDPDPIERAWENVK